MLCILNQHLTLSTRNPPVAYRDAHLKHLLKHDDCGPDTSLDVRLVRIEFAFPPFIIRHDSVFVWVQLTPHLRLERVYLKRTGLCISMTAIPFHHLTSFILNP